MTVTLRRLLSPVTSNRQLAVLLENPGQVRSEPLGIEADLSAVRAVFDGFYNQSPDATSIERARLDRELAIPLHEALRPLSRRIATDMRFWHWLCICELQDIVWYRWYGRVPEEFSGVISPSLAERFTGGPSLHGVSRNSFARLWWCVETLRDDEGDELIRIVLASQDLFQAVFERRFCLYVPAARACIRALGNSNEEDRRDATKLLNHYFTTIVAEALCEDDIVSSLLNRYQRD